MKILMVANFFPRFGETFILEQANALVERGHELTILVLIGQDPGAYDERSIRNGLPDRVIDATSFGKPLSGRIPETIRGVLKALLRHPRALAPLRYGKRSYRGQMAAAVDVLGRLGRFDAIFAAFGPAGVSAEALRDVGLIDGPIVTSFLGYDISREIMLHGPAVYRRLFQNGELFQPNSNFLRARMLENGAPEDRTVLHRLGVDIDVFPYVDRDGHAGPPRIVAVGRFVEKKGFTDLIDAAALLRDGGVAFRLEIAGDGPLDGSFKEQVKRLELEDLVHFPGWCDSNAVSHLLRSADLMAVPSVTARDGDTEGLPLTLVEAASTGLALVGTDHSGIPEILIDGETGLIVPERDPDALAGAMKTLCEDRERRIAMGRAGRALVERAYNADLQAESLIEELARQNRHYYT
ncbi:MAG: glycosyltransferase [Phycisphaerales bacterium]|nr:glycosyltransferase [Phycisphaerales bacterium]